MQLAIAAGGFNSKLVRLKGIECHDDYHLLHCFNSKLVRLKADNKRRILTRTVEFQFQTGSIKRQQLPR